MIKVGLIMYKDKINMAALATSSFFAEDLLLLVPCLAFFVYFFHDKKNNSKRVQFNFWIASGFLSWLLLTTPFWVLGVLANFSHQQLLNNINPIANIIMHSCLIKAYLCLRKK
jgi:heme/copper-type cytochrome/quinol oxidase subunit 4